MTTSQRDKVTRVATEGKGRKILTEEKAAPAVLTRKKTGKTKAGILTPYQVRWLDDLSPRKFYVKSRRIGISWVAAYDAVVSRFRRTQPIERNLFYQAQDEVSSLDFIENCQWFVSDLFGRAADRFIEGWTDDELKRDFTAHCIRLPSGHRIEAMSSNPNRLRGKGGDVRFDEIPFHDDPDALIKAGGPCTRWGGTLAAWGSHNGEGTWLHRRELNARKVCDALGIDIRQVCSVPWNTWAAKHRELNLRPIFSFHHTTIEDAIEEGLLDRINTKRGTQGEKPWAPDEFLQDCRDECEDEADYAEEYMCVPLGSGRSLLTYADIIGCEHTDCAQPEEGLVGYTGQYCTIGVDVGREHDLTVIWVLEWLGDVGWTRQIQTIEKTSLPQQQMVLEEILRSVKWSRCLIDKSGLGLGLYEYTAQKWGSRIEGVDYASNVARDAVCIAAKQAFEDRSVRICADSGRIRDALHGMIKKVVGRRVMYVAPRTKSGHIDEFFAIGQAIEVAKHGGGGWMVAWG